MRGGIRPGAGAPKGNLNRLVHGRKSKQVRTAIEKLTSDPELRPLLRFLLIFARKHYREDQNKGRG